MNCHIDCMTLRAFFFLLSPPLFKTMCVLEVCTRVWIGCASTRAYDSESDSERIGMAICLFYLYAHALASI